MLRLINWDNCDYYSQFNNRNFRLKDDPKKIDELLIRYNWLKREVKKGRMKKSKALEKINNIQEKVLDLSQGKINSLMASFSGYSYQRNSDDLRQSAKIGALLAVDHFKHGKKKSFFNYTYYWMKGAMFLEMENTLPIRFPYWKNLRIKKEQKRFFEEYKRTPTIKELEKNVRIWEKTINNILNAQKIVPLEEFQSEEIQRPLEEVLGDVREEKPFDYIFREEVRKILEDYSKKGEKEKKMAGIIYRKYFEGKTLREIGKELNLTKGRISQLKIMGLKSLRYILECKYPIPKY
jgi:RNA polymerase sigma factor (sigma-70 family)